jgi:hypothetical protein
MTIIRKKKTYNLTSLTFCRVHFISYGVQLVHKHSSKYKYNNSPALQIHVPTDAPERKRGYKLRYIYFQYATTERHTLTTGISSMLVALTCRMCWHMWEKYELLCRTVRSPWSEARRVGKSVIDHVAVYQQMHLVSVAFLLFHTFMNKFDI